jgi:hypothetical protein
MALLKTAGAEAKKLLTSLEDLFRTHPTADALHVTGDNQFFLEKSRADNYAWRLRNKGVATVTRVDFEAVQANNMISAITTEASREGDASLMHPEATAPTPEVAAAKYQADQQAQLAVTEALNAGIETPDEEAGDPDLVAEDDAEKPAATGTNKKQTQKTK